MGSKFRPAPVSSQCLYCSACYYLLPSPSLAETRVSPRDLSTNWQCPDCGASRETGVPVDEHRSRTMSNPEDLGRNT